jgi:hypothetical protein
MLVAVFTLNKADNVKKRDPRGGREKANRMRSLMAMPD